jgi:putative pyruvate formate lyase activating enzyme
MESSRKVLEWFSEHLKDRAWLSLMTQYTPVRIPGETRNIPERQLNVKEYETLLVWLEDFGIDDGYVQELVPGDDWLPDFRKLNPFSSDLSRVIWRWNTGFVRD